MIKHDEMPKADRAREVCTAETGFTSRPETCDMNDQDFRLLVSGLDNL